MNRERMENFKRAVCRMKFPRGAGPITTEQLRDKSPEQIVTFIFRCHTEIHGTATIKKALQSTSEHQIRMLIDKDLRNASPSKGTEDKQDTNQSMATTCDDLPYSEPSEPSEPRVDGEAVPLPSNHKEATASKNKGCRQVP